MPWRRSEPMSERARFVALAEEGLYSMSELCARFQISRKTGYKWLARFQAAGVAGLAEQSRAPHTRPGSTAVTVRQAVLALREQHPTWGARKLVAVLAERQPTWVLPAPSTVGTWLQQEGYVRVRPVRRRGPVTPAPPLRTTTPHEVWTADFKGEFRLGNGELCYPLTILEAHSRFLLACAALPSTASVGAQPVFERLFREVGLPQAIRTDNGSPFASPAWGGLSQLSIGWLGLGIRVERIRPGHPEENGRHERLHRTLKAETTRPPAQDRAGQQARFDAFQAEYNDVRPHEALGQQPPRRWYGPAGRRYPERVLPPEYPGHWEVRKVDGNGCYHFHGRTLFLSGVLAGQAIGLEEVADGLWALHFYAVELGRFHVRDYRLYG